MFDKMERYQQDVEESVHMGKVKGQLLLQEDRIY